MPALALSVPVVIKVFATLVPVVFDPAKVMRLLDVTVAALMFHALVTTAVGWPSETAPVTVKVVPLAWVSD